MAPRKVVVFGVTGNQGGSVAKALLEEPDKWDVWGVSRNPDSKHSQPWKDAGVTLIKGDLDDPSSYAKGLEGAYATFVNANFWTFYKGNNADEAGQKEEHQSWSAVEASVKAGAKHVVYSTLESVEPKQPLPHFDAKARVTKRMRDAKVPGTQIFTSYFYENLLNAKWEEKDGKRLFKLEMPDDAQIPAYSVAQIGLWVRVALNNPEKWIGKDMQVAADLLTPKKIVDVLSEVSGKKWETEHLTLDQFNQLDKDGKIDHELWLNYSAFTHGYIVRDIKESRSIAPDAYDFKTWLQKTPKAKEAFKF